MNEDQQNELGGTGREDQAAKMAAMSKLAAGVAHEINNPCGVLLMKLKFLLSIADEEQLSSRAISTLGVAVEQTERIQTIVDSLVRFSRPTQSMPRPVDVNEAIDGALARTDLPASVSLNRTLSEGLPQVVADPEQLQQVIVEVLSNAVDAMPNGGTLTVTSQLLPTAPGELAIQIRDTGGGIPADFIDRIFDPFFTTKAVGKGTGLGLAVSYGAMQRFGGRIEVTSERGVGTLAQIFLPATAS
ncbi:MAG: hypothetical protein HN712_07675 [Gemmatimonadetes bacterium]|jgi:two-component system, NtrC family, sensor kinase|nr:hypothetical protein [Gemmatimonadota bacterium]MBT7860176.1 hypothetical protein [Gemmatimonadota bacterium]